MKRIPSIKTVMTPFPYSFCPDADVEDALEKMREHTIHHLPVTSHDGDLIGMTSSRDIQLMQNRPDSGEGLKVKDIMAKHMEVIIERAAGLLWVQPCRKRSGI